MSLSDLIFDILSHTTPVPSSKAQSETDAKTVERCKVRIQQILKTFPLYPEIELQTELLHV